MKYFVVGYYLRRVDFSGTVEADDEEDAEICVNVREFLDVDEDQGDDYEVNIDTVEVVDESDVKGGAA